MSSLVAVIHKIHILDYSLLFKQQIYMYRTHTVNNCKAAAALTWNLSGTSSATL